MQIQKPWSQLTSSWSLYYKLSSHSQHRANSSAVFTYLWMKLVSKLFMYLFITLNLCLLAENISSMITFTEVAVCPTASCHIYVKLFWCLKNLQNNILFRTKIKSTMNALLGFFQTFSGQLLCRSLPFSMKSEAAYKCYSLVTFFQQVSWRNANKWFNK